MHQRRARQVGVFRPLGRTHTPYGGYTLTELLVVITIAVILIAAALPIAKRMVDDSRPRDAARLVSGNLTMARTYAAKNNRPFGLEFVLEPPIGYVDPVQPPPPTPPLPVLRHCTRVFLAEVPPPYAGSTTSARGVIRIEPGQTLPEFVPLTGADGNGDGRIDVDTAEMFVLRSLIDEGDPCLVKFEYKGDYFRLVRGTAANTNYPDPNRIYLDVIRPWLPTPPPVTFAHVVASSVSGNAVPSSYDNAAAIGYRYQVLRMPRRVGNPIELTGGTTIDIEYSGMGPRGFDDPTPTVGITSDGGLGQARNRVVVMFSPNGAIDGLVVDNFLMAPYGTVHFLVGNADKVNNPLAAPEATLANPTNLNMFDVRTSNLLDVNSVWVSVGRNGAIATTENLPPPVDPATMAPNNVTIFPGDPRQQALNPLLAADRATFMSHCREVASGRKQMGGD